MPSTQMRLAAIAAIAVLTLMIFGVVAIIIAKNHEVSNGRARLQNAVVVTAGIVAEAVSIFLLIPFAR